ncbi:MAG: UDP-glucose 4-epimerase [Chlamydiae bacterium]|nr:UDP-glucose 4-epimerase [Chlamydiota bacterium]
MERKEKILVTGGAGYIGSVLVPELLSQGYQVQVLDNLNFKQTSLISCFSSPYFSFEKGDVCNYELIDKFLKEADIIIPLAAIVGAPACKENPRLTELVNFESVQYLLSKLSSDQKVLFPTTNSGYGVGEEGKHCTEESPLNPVSLYGRLKVDIEVQILSLKNAISFRLATVFGASPRMRIDLLVNDFVYRAMHDRYLVLFEEHFKRNFIHIKDVANAFLFGIEHFDEMKGQAYNVGLSSANLSKRELCEKIQEYVPDFYFHSAAIGEDPDKRDYIVSNEKLEALGWRPTHSLDDGIKELVGLYQFLKANEYRNV